MSPPTLHTRASSSSIHSLAASFESGHARLGSTTISMTEGGGGGASSTGLNRRGSSSKGHMRDSAPLTPDGPFTAGSSSTSSAAARRSGSGSNANHHHPTSRRLDELYEDNENHNGKQKQPLSTPQLEEYELEDEFLPMNSPFSPGYSMSGSTTSSPTSYRRDSLGLISPEPPNALSAAERREHSRRHSRIHSRNLSGERLK